MSAPIVTDAKTYPNLEAATLPALKAQGLAARGGKYFYADGTRFDVTNKAEAGLILIGYQRIRKTADGRFAVIAN